MLMLRLSALSMIVAGAGIYLYGRSSDDGETSSVGGSAVDFAGSAMTLTAIILVICGLGMLVLAQLLAPVMKSSRRIAEQSGMKVSRLTGAPTMRSGMAVASERMANAQQQMASLTGTAAIRRDWDSGTATVKLAQDTGQQRNLNPVYEVHLMVAPDGRATYDTVVQSEVNSLAVSKCVPGTRVPVRVNPADPQDLVVDWLSV